MIDWTQYTFNDRWFLPHEVVWDEQLYPWMVKCAGGAHELVVLEIGSYEGLSSVWLATAAAKAAEAAGCLGQWQLTCVDAWPGPEYLPMKERALENLRRTGLPREKIHVYHVPSNVLLPAVAAGSCDLIYVDGSHKTPDVYFDTVQAVRIIRSGGRILFDDYANPSTPGEELEATRAGVDSGLRSCGIEPSEAWAMGGTLVLER